MLTIEPIDNEIWDNLLIKSDQGSIFSSTKWCALFTDPFRAYGVYKGDELVGGIIGFEQAGKYISGNYTLTPYQGIMVKGNGLKYVAEMSLHSEIALCLIEFLERTYEGVTIINHWSYPDIRPFLWAGWKPLVKYTYVVDIDDMEITQMGMDKDTRYLSKQVVPVTVGTIKDFYELYNYTFLHKGLDAPVQVAFFEPFFSSISHELISCGESSGVMMWDDKRAYYIFGASKGDGNSTSVLWNLMNDAHKLGYDEIDLVGCNDQKIGAFKRGFGGKLVPYLGATNV